MEAQPADNAPDETGIVYPEVTIQRDDLTKLQEMLHSLVVDALTGALPLDAVPFVREQVAKHANALLHKITDRARQALEKLRSHTYRGPIFVRYHGEGEEEPPDAGSPPPGHTGAIPGRCPANRLVPGTLQSLGNYGVRPPRVGVLCPYFAGGLHWVVYLYPWPITESDAPGALTTDGPRFHLVQLAPGWNPLEVRGAAEAWTREADDRPTTHVIATDGERSMVMYVQGAGFDRRHSLLRIAERILAAGS